MNNLESTFISVTDLQKNTKVCLWNINIIKRKVILSNNKPLAVILSLSEFDELLKRGSNIKEVEPDEWEREAIEKYEERKKTWKVEYIEVTKDYFKNLKQKNV